MGYEKQNLLENEQRDILICREVHSSATINSVEEEQYSKRRDSTDYLVLLF